MKEFDVSEIETNFYDESGNKLDVKVISIFKTDEYKHNYALCAEKLNDDTHKIHVYIMSRNELDEFVFEDIEDKAEKDFVDEVASKMVA